MSTKLVDATTISREDALKQLAAIGNIFPDLQKKMTVRTRGIKINSKGGLYVVDPTMIAVSKEGKEYVSGLNMPLTAAKALFLNKELITKVQEFLAGLNVDEVRQEKQA